MRGDNNAIPVRVQFDRSTIRNGNKGRLTNARKIAVDRPEHHDRRDAGQTHHTEDENAAGSSRYDH